MSQSLSNKSLKTVPNRGGDEETYEPSQNSERNRQALMYQEVLKQPCLHQRLHLPVIGVRCQQRKHQKLRRALYIAPVFLLIH